jgi:hypothetical protein
VSLAGCRLGDVDDPAILRDVDFGFDHVAFLLAGIPLPLYLAWPLDRLFRAVDDQGHGFLTTDADRALNQQNPHGQSFDRRKDRLTLDQLAIGVRLNARQGPKLPLVN